MARKRNGELLYKTVNELPEATVVEVEAWGHPTFRVGKKMFGGSDPDSTTCTLKASKEDQQALLASDPDTFYFPKYVGRNGWVGINLDRIDPNELRELIIEAWRLTAPKRVVAAWDATNQVQ